MTLPDDVVGGLRNVHPDLAWAIVTLFEKSPAAPEAARPDAELVTIAERRSLIVVNRKAFTRLPGVHIIPLDNDRAFLALEPGRGMADLELAVIDRLSASTKPRERKALSDLQVQLRKWRHSRAFRFHTHAIIVVEHASKRREGRHRPSNSVRKNSAPLVA